MSVPSLAAYLKSHNKDVEQIDLNLEFFDKLLSKEFIDLCIEKYETEVIDIEDTRIAPYFSAIGKYVSDNIDKQKAIFRSHKALDIHVYEKCSYFMAMSFAIINATFPGEKIDHYHYESSYNRSSFKSILDSARDSYHGKNSTLLSLLTSYFIDDIIQDVNLIGISLTGLNQIIPSFVLAGAIKRKNPNIKIILGGSVPTRWFAEQRDAPNIFEFVDYVITNEGEVPLVSLIDYLEGKISIENVPQLIYLSANNEITYNNLPITNPDMCSFPTPVFNKKDVRRYLSPVPTLPLLGCRGCYWRKCTFCDHSFVYNNSYRAADIDKIVDDVMTYINEYGVNHINFHDEAMTPKGIQNLSELLLQKGIEIKWSTDARLDKGLTYEVLDKAHQAGLSILFFGLESINQRIIDLMNKGTQTDITRQILFDATKAGIGTHCFFICGFPTETIQEYQDTVNFVKENSNIIASHGCSEFSLSRHSPIARDPEKFHIKMNKIWNKDDASLDYKFERLDVDESYEEERKKIYTKVTKKVITYAQKVSWIIMRDHWIIFWNDIHRIISQIKNIAEKHVLKSGIFLINDNECLLVFDCATSNVFEFDLSAKYIFELIKEFGCNSQEIIISKASQHFGISEEEAECSITEFISLLKEKNLIFMPEAESEATE